MNSDNNFIFLFVKLIDKVTKMIHLLFVCSGKFHEGLRVPTDKGKLSARIQLRPWTNYTFHVTATNSIGESDRSGFTSTPCRTPPTVPHRNPHRVCTTSRSPTQLVIIWEVSSSQM